MANQKNENQKKADEGAKKGDRLPLVVYEFNLDCDGCFETAKKPARGFPGVETVKEDRSAKKLTVTGKFDAVKLQDVITKKIKKKVKFISVQKKRVHAAKKNPEKKKPEQNKPEESNLNLADFEPEILRGVHSQDPSDSPLDHTRTPEEGLEIELECDGCITDIRRIGMKFKGLEMVNLLWGKVEIMVWISFMLAMVIMIKNM